MVGTIMTLADWYASTLDELEDFAAWFVEGQRQNGVGFPKHMSAGDWNEQFESFVFTRPDAAPLPDES